MLEPAKQLWHICLSSDLSTFDPYDIWKAGIGVRVKSLFNISRLLGAAPALARV